MSTGPIKGSLDRLNSDKPRRKYKKVIKTFSHMDKTTVERWIDFMNTIGFKVDGDVYQNQFDNRLWTVKMVRITF